MIFYIGFLEGLQKVLSELDVEAYVQNFSVQEVDIKGLRVLVFFGLYCKILILEKLSFKSCVFKIDMEDNYIVF